MTTQTQISGKSMSKILTAVGACVLTISLHVTGCSPGESTNDLPKQCTADEQCATGAHCDPTQGCVACLFDTHCDPNQRCLAGSCAERVACTSDSECTASNASICDALSKECVQCVSDTNCGESAHCVDHVCVPFAKCSTDKDCSGTVCDLGKGECVECLTHANCKNDQLCVEQSCQKRCSTDADCGNKSCDVQAGHCVECLTDDECPSVYHCKANRCTRDLCEQGKASCDPTSTATRTCSANGSEFKSANCPAGQACKNAQGTPACVPLSCLPNQVRCRADGAAIETCAADGLSVASTTACEDGTRCVLGKCVPIGCSPNQLFCEDGVSRLCNHDGTASSVAKECETAEYCDTHSGECRRKACEPSAITCVGTSVGTCRADGSGYDLQACPRDQTCSGGKCTDIVCAPQLKYCDSEGRLRTCNGDGTASQAETCWGASTCQSTAFGAECRSQTCAAGSAVCNGHIATKCRSDGKGLEALGIDCAKIGSVCRDGQCRPPVCEPNTRFCKDNNVHVCATDGRNSSVSQYCNWNQTCLPSTAQCASKVCTAGATRCNFGILEKCEDGYRYVALEDCAASNKACVDGRACASVVCSPNKERCQGNVRYRCNATGTAELAVQTCAETQYCHDNGSSTFCSLKQCTPGKPVCTASGALAMCKADASGPDGAGAPCPDNTRCMNGECKPVVCKAFERTCKDGHVWSCNGDGTAQSLTNYCFSDQHCKSGVCIADVCVAGTNYCAGENLSKCNGEGSGPLPAPTDCKAQGKVCTQHGCASSAQDIIGGPSINDWASGSTVFGNVFKVEHTRKLTKIEIWDNFAGSADWLVYVSVDGVNYHPLSKTTSTIPSSVADWRSSPNLSELLSKGAYYFVGVRANSPRMPHEVSAPQALAFSTALGAVELSASSAPENIQFVSTNSRLFYMRLTTTAE